MIFIYFNLCIWYFWSFNIIFSAMCYKVLNSFRNSILFAHHFNCGLITISQ